MKNLLIMSLILALFRTGYSQENLYESKEIQKAYAKETRSRQGVPGKAYWQNTIRYTLKAALDTESRLLKGKGTIIYENNSPDTLKYMLIKLLPNLHKKGNARDYAVGPEQLNNGMVIDSIAFDKIGQQIENRKIFREYSTNLYVIFNQSEQIAPGSQKELYISWHYEVIKNGIRNGGYCDSAFFIGYWYPQIAVYDDVYGWDREDYTGLQETYNDLGIYDVELTVPNEYVIWATGNQTNESEIFSEKTQQLINKSRQSDVTISIINESSYANNEIFKPGKSNTWKFKADSVPDFAWACSNYYYWDANSLKVDGGNRSIWINAVYPPGTASFDRVADVARQSANYLSNVFPGIPYPFDKHITFNGIHKIAVEYPMMANNSDYPDIESYTELTIHEIAHNYIPFYMLSNERKHAWIDEGWVKLIGELYGESIGIKREDKQSLNTISIYEKMAGSSNDLPLITPSGNMTTRYNFFHSYAKAANANMFLLELMKEKGIDNPLKGFLLNWKGKHPTPYDFFYYMNNLCDEDLSWFWKPWYFEFKTPDLALEKSQDPENILVINKGGMPLPIVLTITYDNFNEIKIEKSIWSWANGTEELVVSLPNFGKIKSVKLGTPAIPDINKENNVLNFVNEELGKL